MKGRGRGWSQQCAQSRERQGARTPGKQRRRQRASALHAPARDNGSADELHSALLPPSARAPVAPDCPEHTLCKREGPPQLAVEEGKRGGGRRRRGERNVAYGRGARAASLLTTQLEVGRRCNEDLVCMVDAPPVRVLLVHDDELLARGEACFFGRRAREVVERSGMGSCRGSKGGQ